jgi:fermentation-respiration switch protein FrsA (DUF1100 family)
MWRDVYRDVLSPEIFLGHEDIRELMSSVARYSTREAPPELDATASRARQWCEQQSLVYRDLVNAAGDADDAERMVRTLLRQSAPMASALGCWLQGMSAPGVFEDEVQLKVLTLLADDAGVGRPASSRFDEFQLLLKRNMLPELAVEPHELTTLRSVRDQMFALPAVLYSISRRSDELGPEICGVDFALRTVGTYPCWEALRARAPQVIDWGRLNLQVPSGSTDLGEPLALSARVVEQYRLLGAATERRIEQGAAWVVDALGAWSDQLLEECRASTDPEEAMAALVREKARQACVYHHDFSLEGRDLSTWLRESMQDPMPLLKVLSRSRLIKPGNSAKSPLVTSMVSAKGPMFRVFDRDDTSVIRRWIDWLPSAEDDSPRRTPSVENGRAGGYRATAVRIASDHRDQGRTPKSIRDAYFLMQGRALAPQTREFAVQYVQRWLAQARRSVDRSDRSLPKEWSHDGLRPWLLEQHDKHDSEFVRSKTEDTPSREAIIDSTLQLAPLTLIDGSWLQGFTDLSLASSRIGCFLFETYWDELGNGDIELNHPKIYRDVLHQMGIDLPPTGTREFAEDPRFRDASFRLPVYWLCLGKLPATFTLEILGLNLAMELSGVGGSYRSARQFLKHYGFSTRFVDIHNTIDNVSSGHSAWAADAVDTYMRRIVRQSGPGKLAAAWERVRIGYESLEPLPSRLTRLLDYRFPSGRKEATRDDHDSLFHHTPVRMGA